MEKKRIKSRGRTESNVIQQIHQPVIEQQLSQNNIALYFAAVKLAAISDNKLLIQVGHDVL